MTLANYYFPERVLYRSARVLARWCAERGRNGPAGEELPLDAPPPSGDQSRATAVAPVAALP